MKKTCISFQFSIINFQLSIKNISLPPQYLKSNKLTKQKQAPSQQPIKTRERRVSFMMNDDEYNAVERYLSKYRITNKSNWYRTVILTHVLKMMEEDYPTLFKENEMRR